VSFRIEIDVEAGNMTLEREVIPPAGLLPQHTVTAEQPLLSNEVTQPPSYGSNLVGGGEYFLGSAFYVSLYSQPKKVVTQRGKDVYDVLWSVEVTVARVLKKERIEDSKHVETNWEVVS